MSHEFGAMHPSGGRPEDVHIPESVHGDDVHAGGNNTGGVSRPRRRGIVGKKPVGYAPVVARNYHVANGVQFNNLEEVFQDSISPEYAQQIMEDVFGQWGVPFDQPRALKYCEDLIFAFIIAVSASDKADYNVVFDVPIEPVNKQGINVTTLDGDLGVLSSALQRKYGVTRRQFARGIADRVRAYLGDPENVHVLDDVATKVGCDRQMAYLGFDGSTHCKAMNTREVQFTKTLENRNLFEREDETARGASDRLLNSLTNGVRAVR